MATNLEEVKISTLRQFTNFLEKEIPKSKDGILWFRGCGQCSYKLSPSIHRHPTITSPESVIQLENKLIGRFNQRSVPFLSKTLDRANDWEVLFFMQHYAVPTRLLDWSENPFIALYFALTSAHYNVVAKSREYIEDASIWVLDPVIWNKEALKDFTFDQGILSVDDHFVNSFRPKTDFGQMREKPVAIFGTHNSSRIVAQRGVFTVFGKLIKSLEDIYTTDNFPEGCLKKIIFPKEKITMLLNSLTSVGITDSVVYPDLEGLAKELKRFFKFDI